MLNQSSNAFSLQTDESSNVISLDKARFKRYNPQAAFYALPKAFINRLLFQISGSTLKVFLAIVNHTDCWNVIRYPEKITHSGLMKTTGIKKKDTISKAYRELNDLGIIGGYVPGHGSDNTKFYFTFDIDHYKSQECCLKLEDMSSYYDMLLSGKYSGAVPEEYEAHPDEDPAASNADDAACAVEDHAAAYADNAPRPDESCDLPQEETPDILSQACAEPVHDPGPLSYMTTIVDSWGKETRLFQGRDSGLFLREDGSLFCTESEFNRVYRQSVLPDPAVLKPVLAVTGPAKVPDSLSNPAEETGEVRTPALKILPGSAKKGTPSPQKTGQGSTIKRDSLNTINSYKINSLIVNANKDFKFKHEFNEFCTEDSAKYLKNTLFWVMKNAADYDLSIGDVIESLSAANDKGKQGSMCYLIGIMRNKSGNKARGIRVITKPLLVQVKQYFQERFGHSLEYLDSYNFDIETRQLRYTLKDPGTDSAPMADFFRFVVDDIKKAVGVSLSAVEVN